MAKNLIETLETDNRTIAAKVVAKTSVYEEKHEINSIVMVDEITFRNLEAKGRLKKATPEEVEEASKPEAKKKK